MSATPRVRPQLVDEAVAHVREQIMRGDLAAGAPVRPESVAEELGISSTPAREALQTLRAEAFLELAPRRGFTVAAMSGDDIRDIYLVESFVAGELAARTASIASPEFLARLEAMHEELNAAADRSDRDALEAWNFRFHREINLAASSPKLAWVIQLTSHYIPRKFYTTLEGWAETTIADHVELLDAFRAGDAKRVRRQMSEHVADAGEAFARHLDRRATTTEAVSPS